MKAYLLYEAGGTDKLVLGEVPKPTLKNGEVLVKIKAIGINPADTIYRNSETFITHIFGEKRPVIMGWDISGEVVEKAENTDGFEIGDAVFCSFAKCWRLCRIRGSKCRFISSSTGEYYFRGSGGCTDGWV
jgi:NADPH:quinone reductase-like Zn-dependent oxidoreductase